MKSKLRAFPAVLLSLSSLSACGESDAGTTPGAGATTASGGSATAGASPVGQGGVSASAGSNNPTGGSALGGQPGAGSGGQATAGSGGGLAGAGSVDYALDCGQQGIVIEGHGPPENRVNYVIVGDGYDQADIDGGVYLGHVMDMINGRGEPGTQGYVEGRFGPEMEPYKTYRNFINICALKVVSVDSGIVTGTDQGGCPGPPDTAFDGCGDDTSRLGHINNQKVDAAVAQLAPSDMEVDWVGVMMNDSEWWNSGANPMVWSGGHPDAALAAMHEGGHGFQNLSDEYGGCAGDRINVTSDSQNTEGKWTHWLGFNQDPGTGEQLIRQCDGSKWAPTEDSVMNDLWVSPYFNSISLENAVRVLYEMVRPIDSSTPSNVTTPQVLEVKVIDPEVIGVDWSVDGTVVAPNGGATFDVVARALASGSHQISARAHDDTAWVPMDTPHGREDLEQVVEWTINVP